MSGPVTTSDGVHALVDTIRALWPGSDPGLTGRGEARAIGGLQFAVVPNAHRPRLLVPLDPSAAAARAIRRFSSSLSLPTRVARVGAAGAVRLGAARALPDRIVVRPGSSPSLTDHLAEVFGGPVVVSLGVGTARVNRKPVLQLFDSTGRTLGFAKVATSAQSSRDVRGEAEALATVARRRWRSLAVPRVVHQTEWNSMFVLVISALPAGARLWERSQGPPLEAMHELASAFDEGEQVVADTAWWSRVSSAAGSLPDIGQRDAFAAAAERFLSLEADRKVRIGAWHGDWTAWNMAWHRGVVQLWDWERFETGVPAGIDAVHFAVNEAVTSAGLSPSAIRGGVRRAIADVPRSGARALGAMYLLTVAGRYLPLAHGELGHLLRPRSDATLEALEDWLR